MVTLIAIDELRDKIERGEPLHIFEVLAPMYWRKHHLPGAINMPPTQVLEVAAAHVPDKSDQIVLYCWDDDCPTSAWAAQELAAAGYLNIREYRGGKKEWRDAGLPMTKD
jgi:rhodanese-related sulfurtransferase